MNALLAMMDLFGVYGSSLHYTFILMFVGSAMAIFVYLWGKGRLDMDEEPKIQMMQTDQESQLGETSHEQQK